MDQKLSLRDLEYFPGYLEQSLAEQFFQDLQDLQWSHVKYGSRQKTQSCFVYSCSTGQDEIRNNTLNQLIRIVGTWFDFVVVSMCCTSYPTGNHYTPEHQDTYGDAHVFTFSFGASRAFHAKHIVTGEKIEYMLNGGDMMYFSPKHNAEYKHSVPKTAKSNHRISVTLIAEKIMVFNLDALQDLLTKKQNQDKGSSERISEEETNSSLSRHILKSHPRVEECLPSYETDGQGYLKIHFVD